MSRTFNTSPLQYRVDQNPPVRIKRTKPPFHQYYPCERGFLQEAVLHISPQYLWGLKSIELIPQTRIYASVFGSYLPSEKRILLYSIPMIIIWKVEDFQLANSIIQCRGFVAKRSGTYFGCFPQEGYKTLWYWRHVFCHELAHHYIQMNRFRRKKISAHHINESRANLIGEKIFWEMVENS